MEIKNNRSGFTLVELSIVLVIIGLLIGGILVAQSLINSAKVQSVVRTLQQYESSIAGFKSKYRKFPGDTAIMGTAGNDNGILEGGFVFSTGTEMGGFWVDLQRGGFLTTLPTMSNDSTGGIKHGNATPNIPELDIGIGGGVLPYSANENPIVDRDKKFKIANYNATGNAISTIGDVGFVNPADALAIDVKIDDGSANDLNGHVLADPISADCFTGAVYDIAEEGSVCKLYVDMFITADF